MKIPPEGGHGAREMRRRRRRRRRRKMMMRKTILKEEGGEILSTREYGAKKTQELGAR